MSDNTGMEFLDHPGIGIFRRDGIGCVESLCSGGGEPVPRIITGMTKHKYQIDAGTTQLFQPFIYKSTPGTLSLVLRLDRQRGKNR